MFGRPAARRLVLLAAAVATVLPVSGPPPSLRLAADAPPRARAALAFHRVELARASRSYARPEPPANVPVLRHVPRGTIYPQAKRPAAGAASGGAWACVRQRESGGNYRRNSGNGFYGAVQWLPSTWNAAVRAIGQAGYANGRADLAPAAVQDQAAAAWQAAHGWGPWPNTSRACGLR